MQVVLNLPTTCINLGFVIEIWRFRIVTMTTSTRQRRKNVLIETSIPPPSFPCRIQTKPSSFEVTKDNHFQPFPTLHSFTLCFSGQIDAESENSDNLLYGYFLIMSNKNKLWDQLLLFSSIKNYVLNSFE